jgi:hypothetical protein
VSPAHPPAQVTVEGGKDWPQLESISKAERVVSLNLRPGRARKGTAGEARALAFQALQALKRTYTTRGASGSQVRRDVSG